MDLEDAAEIGLADTGDTLAERDAGFGIAAQPLDQREAEALQVDKERLEVAVRPVAWESFRQGCVPEFGNDRSRVGRLRGLGPPGLQPGHRHMAGAVAVRPADDQHIAAEFDSLGPKFRRDAGQIEPPLVRDRIECAGFVDAHPNPGKARRLAAGPADLEVQIVVHDRVGVHRQASVRASVLLS